MAKMRLHQRSERPSQLRFLLGLRCRRSHVRQNLHCLKTNPANQNLRRGLVSLLQKLRIRMPRRIPFSRLELRRLNRYRHRKKLRRQRLVQALLIQKLRPPLLRKIRTLPSHWPYPNLPKILPSRI